VRSLTGRWRRCWLRVGPSGVQPPLTNSYQNQSESNGVRTLKGTALGLGILNSFIGLVDAFLALSWCRLLLPFRGRVGAAVGVLVDEGRTARHVVEVERMLRGRRCI
jgi:hypothetical protein